MSKAFNLVPPSAAAAPMKALLGVVQLISASSFLFSPVRRLYSKATVRLLASLWAA
ncbi:hypothetical protein BD01_1697 [Thermococcus nautili]|uniref:Uncharacterized protein n=1 Tax=Thermococcus nautili TaxID=195522 RepID=W8P6Z9_9EURY|nr:hypothetical protein BD01_1697 [Thermococcus nautili]